MRLPFRHLLIGALLAIWCAALSGVALDVAPTAMLALHLVSGIGGIVPVVAFLRRHWWPRRRNVGRHPNARLGYVALTSLCLLTTSGVLLLPWTNIKPLRWLHYGAMVVLLLDLAIHMAWRLRRRAFGHRQPRGRRRAMTWVLGGMITASLAGIAAWAGQILRSPAPETIVAVGHASLGNMRMLSVKDCMGCHSDISEQWRISAHANAATDPYYQALTAVFIQERGVEAAQYCATCHNPVGLMQGEVDPNAAARVLKEGGTSYEARAIGVAVPLSDRASEGATCVLCHQAAAAADPPTNGSLRLDVGSVALSRNIIGRLSVRAVPDTHKELLARPVLQQAQMCGSCHNLRLPDGRPLEPTYDEWMQSPYPAEGKTCQSCHMPVVQARKVDSSLPEPINAHGGIPGAPSSLPMMADNLTLLQTAATMHADLATDGENTLRATVTITNSGTGHYLPTGSDDLRQVWLEVVLKDGEGKARWTSGILDEYGRLEPDTVQFHKVLGDENGQPIELHRFWATEQILSDTRLAPMERRQIPYRIPITQSIRAPYTLTVRLLYRDVSQAFAEFALERPVLDLPTREMARVMTVLNSAAP